jgi:MFS family permease
MSVFMVGLPLGIALGYVVSGTIADHFGWRAAFFVAGIPGLILAGISLLMREPRRGLSEAATVGTARRSGAPYRIVLTIPTMWWIIASGAVHNFAMYALSSFLPAFLVRYHHTSVQAAGFVSGIVIGSLGAAGMLLGGWLGDIIFRCRPDGRMLVAGVATLISVPAGFLALNAPQGALAAFTVLQGTACLFLYVYYATVYATIQDVVEPSLRGTAMAMYFFAMYLLGASLGPLGAGWLSDFLARAAARNAHALLFGATIPEQFRAIGLHRAMHVVPLAGIILAAVLFAGSVTVRKDIARLRTWMNQTASKRTGS